MTLIPTSKSVRRRALVATAAAGVLVAVGAVAAPAYADETATITVHLTDAGAPVTGYIATLYDTEHNIVGGARSLQTNTVTFSDLLPGGYKVEVNVGGIDQWIAGKTSFDTADVVNVTASQTATIDESLLPYGTLSGHVTNTDGTAAAMARVVASRPDGSGVLAGYTNDSGDYSITYLPAGSYIVQFRKDLSSPIQYADNATTVQGAKTVTLTGGATTVVNQTLLPFATLTGTVTSQGAPAPYVQVSVQSLDYTNYAYTSTDAAGNYAVNLWPGTYTVQFTNGGLTQFAPGKTTQADAGHYTLSSGTTVLDEALLPTGTITGRLTTSDGTPVPFSSVSASLPGGTSAVAYGFTDGNGSYTMTTFAGSYRLAFNTPYGIQWATGRSSSTEADLITVPEFGTVTHDEVLVPLGTISATAVDATTGAALTSFCAYGDGLFGVCTDTGTLTLSALPGRYTVYFNSSSESYYFGDTAVTSVTSGATTPVVFHATKAATVSTTIRDRVTNQPVANACLQLLDVTRPNWLGAGSLCTDASGTWTDPSVQAGTYKAFVFAHDGVHGDQWVGPGTSGGVGEFEQAKTITVTPGQTVTLSDILLDEAAGDITGTITDEVTGAPIPNAFVGLSSWDTGYGGQERVAGTDAQGRYTISGLGPYHWTLFFRASGYASEFSGDSPTRAKAKDVKLKKKGDTTTYDLTMGTGTTLTGTVIGPDGTPVDSARITIISASSGDEITTDDIYAPIDPAPYVVHVKGATQVKVKYYAQLGGVSYEGWVGGTGFADATTLSVPASGTITLNITVS